MTTPIRICQGFDAQTKQMYGSGLSGDISIVASDLFGFGYAIQNAQSGGSSYIGDGLKWGTTGGNWVDWMYHCYCTYHFKYTALPGTGQYFYQHIELDSGTNYRFGVRVASDGTYQTQSSGGWSSSSSGAIQAGKWYVATMKWSYGSECRFIVRDDAGSEIINMAEGSFGNYRHGLSRIGNSTGYGTIQVDNWIGAGVDTNNPTQVWDPYDDLGFNFYVGLMVPDADGSSFPYNNWGNTYANVDEKPPDGVADMYMYATSGKQDSVSFEPVNTVFPYKPLTYEAVSVYALYKTSSGSRNFNVGLYSGTTWSQASSATISTTFTWHEKLWTVDPDDSNPWTESKINAMEGTMQGGGGSPAVYQQMDVMYCEALCTIAVPQGLEVLRGRFREPNAVELLSRPYRRTRIPGSVSG